MYYKLNLYLSILYFVTTICSAQQKEYDAVKAVIDKIETPFFLVKKDTIELVDYSFKINEVLLKGYLRQKEIKLNQKVKPSSNFFEWVDKKYAWILTDSDINYMIKSLRKQKKIFWNKKKLMNSKKYIQIVDYPIFSDNIIEDLERQKRIKSEKFIYFFSKPIFNQKKDIFIIQYDILLLPYSKMTLIYKKENGVWIQIASLSQNW